MPHPNDAHAPRGPRETPNMLPMARRESSPNAPPAPFSQRAQRRPPSKPHGDHDALVDVKPQTGAGGDLGTTTSSVKNAWSSSFDRACDKRAMFNAAHNEKTAGLSGHPCFTPLLTVRALSASAFHGNPCWVSLQSAWIVRVISFGRSLSHKTAQRKECANGNAPDKSKNSAPPCGPSPHGGALRRVNLHHRSITGVKIDVDRRKRRRRPLVDPGLRARPRPRA